MADTGYSSGSKDGENDSPTKSEEKRAFKDPLISGLDITDDADMESLSLDASGKSDLSISRSSSLIANLSHFEDAEDDTHDLFVNVDDPEKHTGTMESYVTFRVNAKTTRSEYDDSEYSVRRRYNDFLWLRQRLEETYPTHLVPEFQAYKKQGTGLLGRVTDSLHNISASYMNKNRPPEFVVMYDYIHALSEKISVMDRICQRVSKEQAEHLIELSEWGPIYTLWSNSEEELVPSLLAMSDAVDKCCQYMREVIDANDDDFAQPLKEYILFTDAIKAVLRRRDAIQMEFDATVDELNRKKDEREQLKISDQTYSIGAFLGKDPEDVKQQKQEKLEHNIEELTKQMEELNDKTVCADTDLRADMERWHKNKQKDLKELFMSQADRQIKYYEKCLKSWEGAIRKIQAKDLEYITTEVPEEPTEPDSS
ncbi:SNX7_30 [Mytilus edulis]|uniref:SNX7_30 n=1 Tax=Mytilus edulis TaxID=6550 RepID=A0A8S3Q476_MYTED|nr:SNX7_30 [Mytilus edulis]